MRGPDEKTTARARSFRREATKAETILWRHLQNRQLSVAKFVRQEPIGPYFADFACRKAKLIVEIDGPTHENKEAYDAQRTARLSALGYRVIRFTNDQIFGDLGPVLDEITRHL
jgi:very-short-patch-repair endonuclease